MSNNRYLLDTHALIWFQSDNITKISGSALDIIKDSSNVILCSQISLFEIAIKQKVGKLPLFDTSIEDILNLAAKDGFTFLNIHNAHIYQYHSIPFNEFHRDPFDRLLIATAFVEKAIILSADRNFKLYDALVETVW